MPALIASSAIRGAVRKVMSMFAVKLAVASWIVGWFAFAARHASMIGSAAATSALAMMKGPPR